MAATIPAADAPDEDVLAWLRHEYEVPFAGWDFSYLDGRSTAR